MSISSRAKQSPESKAQFEEMTVRRFYYPMMLPRGSKAVPFWMWNRHGRSQLVELGDTPGAFGRPKASRPVQGSLARRAINVFLLGRLEKLWHHRFNHQDAQAPSFDTD